MRFCDLVPDWMSVHVEPSGDVIFGFPSWEVSAAEAAIRRIFSCVGGSWELENWNSFDGVEHRRWKKLVLPADSP